MFAPKRNSSHFDSTNDNYDFLGGGKREECREFSFKEVVSSVLS